MNKNTVLKCSNYTSTLTRALKEGSPRIHCNTSDDAIYICNGYFAVKLNGYEYDALVRPVTQRDPGNWALQENGDLTPDPINIAELMHNTADDAGHTITAAPMFFDVANGRKGKSAPPPLVCYYSAEADFVAGFNPTYAEIVASTLERRSKSATAPMVVLDGGDPIALILPVRISDKPNIARAVRAWFTDSAADGQSKTDEAAEKLRQHADDMEKTARQYEDKNKGLARDLETLRQQYAEEHIENEDLRRQVEELQTVLAAKNEQIEALVDRLNAQPDPQPHEAEAEAQPQDKAAALVQKLSALPNVTATVNGAQTAAPVVWLSGDTDAHKNEIEEMGGKWSGKRGAWYFKIA